MTVAVGSRAPAFTVETTHGAVGLESLLAGGPLLLVFYVEDLTPACTAQLCAFRDEFETLRALGATVLGVSADEIAAHQRFAEAMDLPFPLAADPDLALADAYGVVSEDGRRAQRAVFVIRPDGVIAGVFAPYQPGVAEQFMAVFEALGLGDS
jgi:peroxiredoxin Q/BCP